MRSYFGFLSRVVVLAALTAGIPGNVLAEVRVIHSFSAGLDSFLLPRAGLIRVGDEIIGTTLEGGDNQAGGIYAVNLMSGVTRDAYSFDDILSFPNDGSFPNGSPLPIDGYIYGTTRGGGDFDEGVVYRVRPDGDGYEALFSFDSFDVPIGVPVGGVVVSGSELFGVARLGDTESDGAIYSYELDSGTVSALHQFPLDGSEGTRPGSIQLFDDRIIGVTGGGGATDGGVIFSLATDGQDFQLLHQFSSPTSASSQGHSPVGRLTRSGGYLYGATSSGGDSGLGVVFRIKEDGTGYSVVHNFSGDDGWLPQGSLVESDGLLFGLTSQGGRFGQGAAFSISTADLSFRNQHFFNGTDGASPVGGLILADGLLYGTTARGGEGAAGVVFALNPLADPGDYNGDSRVDAADYAAWRSAYGGEVSSGEGADGNLDGVIDAADYTVWRDNLVVSSPALPGDYNDDGQVDAADYTVWRDNLGEVVYLPGDSTPGYVSSADYQVWRSNYGATSFVLTKASQVPEPGTWSAALVLVVSAYLILPYQRSTERLPC